MKHSKLNCGSLISKFWLITRNGIGPLFLSDPSSIVDAINEKEEGHDGDL
jgi:hypothetical protein